MGVQGIDVNVQQMISGAQLDTQKQIDETDEGYEARKKADKKIQVKKEQVKSSDVHRETFNRRTENDQKMQQVLGGAAGPEAQEGAQQWQNNKELQQKLTDAQKEMFKEAMAKNPPKASKAAKAMENMSKQQGFQKAVSNSEQMGTLQKGMLENPAAEKPVSQMLQGRFMQSGKADPKAKNNFLRFGMEQMKKGNMDAAKKAGDMMGNMTKNKMPKTAQRAAMNMAQRTSGDPKAMKNVDAFMQDPNVGKMPSFARGKATELLSKANGKGEVKEGFEKLAGDPKFKAQTAQNKGRFFSTIGTGRASEFRQLTDKSLNALQSKEFPNRSGQVGKFLNKMAGQIQKGGADAVDVKTAMKAAKSSPLPKAPRLITADDDADPEEIAKARSHNRAQILQYYNSLARSYEKSEKQLNSAKYLEDVNSLKNLRAPEGLDTSALTPEELALVEERGASVAKTLERVKKLQRQKARELRTKRMPPAKRRARAARRRAQGRQPKYFNPNAGKAGASSAFLQAAGGQPQGLPSTPMAGSRGQRSAAGAANVAVGGGSVDQQVASALSGMNLGDGPITPQQAGQVANAIAQSVAQSVAQQVTHQLLGGDAGMAPMADAAPPPQVQPQTAPQGQQGKVDGWGIPRSFEADLGAKASVRPVKAPQVQADFEGPTMQEVLNEKYSGRVLVKDPTAIRGLNDLFASNWKDCTKAEMALLKNLGWNQQTWDTKDSPAAKWPNAMMTAFVNLNPVQRESVRKLGFTPHDWDTKVQAFTSGRNA